LARLTRPDIAYAVGKLSQFMGSFDKSHWEAGKVLLRYLQNTRNLGLLYKSGEKLVLTGYADADYAGDVSDRKSTSGFVFTSGSNVISWSSHKQETVSCSSTEAEYKALHAAAKEAVWLKRHMEELKIPTETPVKIYVDNQSAIKIAQNPEFHKRTKHIDVKYHHIRELVNNKLIEVDYIPTLQQKADGLTKPLPKTKHQAMIEELGMTTPEKCNTTKERNTSPKVHGQKHSKLAMLALNLLFISTFISLASTTNTSLTSPYTHGITTVKRALDSKNILWRPVSGTPVTTGHQLVIIRIKLISPCNVITSEYLHRDATADAIERCNLIYEENFIHELKKMCPVETHHEIMMQRFPHNVSHRPKRFISALVGILIISMITIATIAVAGAVQTTINSGKIADLQSEMMRHDRNVEAINRNVDTVALAVNTLQKDFNQLVERVGNLSADYQELKDKHISTGYLLSYLTTRLLMGKLLIQEATRRWKDKQVYAPFLDWLNITFPCGDNCPIKLAIPQHCSLSEDTTTLHMEFNLPNIDPILKIVEADPFKLLMKTRNKTCSIEYTGPRHMMMNVQNDCMVNVNVILPRKTDMILAPGHACVEQPILSRNKYFTYQQHSKSTELSTKELHSTWTTRN